MEHVRMEASWLHKTMVAVEVIKDEFTAGTE
jgi:hypothetical protein